MCVTRPQRVNENLIHNTNIQFTKSYLEISAAIGVLLTIFFYAQNNVAL